MFASPTQWLHPFDSVGVLLPRYSSLWTSRLGRRSGANAIQAPRTYRESFAIKAVRW